MTYMTVWSIPPENMKVAIERFKEGKEPMEGLKDLGRWHEVGTGKGIRLIETDDPVALAKVNAFWSDLIDLKTVPVMDDEGIAKIL